MDALGQGVVTTLALTVLAFVGALLLGTLVAACRLSPVPALRAVGTVYVGLFRNVPLLSLLVLAAYGLPYAGVDLPLLGTAVVSLTLVAAAPTGEALRVGLGGLAGTGTRVALPQALPGLVRPLVDVFTGVALGSSLAAVVSVGELTYQAQQLGRPAGSALPLVAAAGGYVVVVALARGVGGLVEQRLPRRTSGARRAVLVPAAAPARHRDLVASVVIGALVGAVLLVGLARLGATGQLDPARWAPLGRRWVVGLLLEGLHGTMLVTLVSALAALPLGALLAAGRSDHRPVLSAVCRAYVVVFRSVPTLVLVLVLLAVLPGTGLRPSPFWLLTLPLVLVHTAAVAEIVRPVGGEPRAGGSTTAAPALVLQLVALVGDSTLGYVVGYPELMTAADDLAGRTRLLLQVFVLVTAVYVVVDVVLRRLATWLERRTRSRNGTPAGGSGSGPSRPDQPAAAPSADPSANVVASATAPPATSRRVGRSRGVSLTRALR